MVRPAVSSDLDKIYANSPTGNGLSLSTVAIRRHIATLVLTVAIIVLGLFFVQQLPVDLLPSIT